MVPCAIAIPSCVAVPRPSSSRITSERRVACCRMRDVSSSSTLKVERPAMMASFAPTRVKMRSTGERATWSAGTQQPRWAIRTVRHACRSSVDLPPMLGPVTSRKAGLWVSEREPRKMSLGIGSPRESVACTHTLMPCLISRKGCSASMNSGRLIPVPALTCARASKQSISAVMLTAFRHKVKSLPNLWKRRLATAFRAASCCTLASRYSFTSSRSSSVQKRFMPFLELIAMNSGGMPRRSSVASLTAS
mmetsp:Transcript_60765/g.100931  ORF Transcript_60765/g.100931 Transcript_60765/m.100931 type:complete len:249 (+) Transcript_60765:450-1196(+)